MIVLGTGVSWGLSFSLLRIASESGFHPFGLTLWQVIITAIFLLPICLIKGRYRNFSWRSCKYYIVLALVGNAVPSVLYFYSAPHVSVGLLAITIALVPMLTYALAWMVKLEPFAIKRILGILFGFTAVSILVLPETSLPDPGMAFWLILVIGSALCYAIESVYVDAVIPKTDDVIILLAGAQLFSIVFLAPLVFITDSFAPISLPLDQATYALIVMSIINICCYMAFLTLIRLSGSVFACQTGYVVTLAGVFWGIWLFNEQHSGWVWLALAFMMAGVFLVTPRQTEKHS